MMRADPTMNLIVQACLAASLVFIAGNLHAVHAQVRFPPARPVGVFGIDERQRNEGPAVLRPANQLRELLQRRFPIEDRPSADALGQHVQGSERRLPITPGPANELRRVDLEFD